MKYRVNQKNGDPLSILGYGCMRYTKKGIGIDQEKAEREMLYALKWGVNYFDTAYIYPGCEEALGKFLSKGYREKVYIATKLPHYMVKKTQDLDRFFYEQCKRLRTNYIDYYLIHMLNDAPAWERLKAIGIEEWIQTKKREGKIRNIGFSFHGGTHSFTELIDMYSWDFCQIQFNYMDVNNQAGLRGLRYANKKGLPVIIMEPLRGGRLVNNLPPRVKSLWEHAKPARSAAEWALRFVWNFDEATVVLSGMNSLKQVRDNVRAASLADAGALTDQELKLFKKAKAEMERKIKIGCTGCGYCMPCPKGVDIPTCFRCYNLRYMDGWYTAIKEYFMCTIARAKHTNASQCVKCGKCEKHCPQGIPIRKELEQTKKEMEGFVFRVLKLFAKFRFKG